MPLSRLATTPHFARRAVLCVLGAMALLAAASCLIEDVAIDQADVFICKNHSDCIEKFQCLNGVCQKALVWTCDDFDGDGVRFGPQCPPDEAVDCDDTDRFSYPAHGVVPAAQERCDGKDNNCNGEIDEGVRVECPKKQGVCAAAQAVQLCVNGGLVPSDCNLGCPGDGCAYGPDYVPDERAAQLWDGLDNDCNGVVDDGKPSCVPGGECGTECLTQTGLPKVEPANCACKKGTWNCAGTPRCVDSGGNDVVLPFSQPELANNGIDDDCDGRID